MELLGITQISMEQKSSTHHLTHLSSTAGPRERETGRNRTGSGSPDILKEYGFKEIFVFNPWECTRGAQIRFNPLTGWSHHSYSDGSDVHIDGEPKGARGRIKGPLTKSQEKFGSSSSKLF
ncbi:hypothetical protein Tsubulata_050889 [Turnera subulata]|uniref:Uncharacterized protein n=1 Tax=Turnera subulata TaxID=218843 RepID=A0A9Q0FDZ5_9ROSI|nr:hypothetical protein Tsubulata_050889 [Turnera subulata]